MLVKTFEIQAKSEFEFNKFQFGEKLSLSWELVGGTGETERSEWLASEQNDNPATEHPL